MGPTWPSVGLEPSDTGPCELSGNVHIPIWPPSGLEPVGTAVCATAGCAEQRRELSDIAVINRSAAITCVWRKTELFWGLDKMKRRTFSGLGGKLQVRLFMLPASTVVFSPELVLHGGWPRSRPQVTAALLQLLGRIINSSVSPI